MSKREEAVVDVLNRRAKGLQADDAATEWGILGARNALRWGHSAHYAIKIGEDRIHDMMHVQRDNAQRAT